MKLIREGRFGLPKSFKTGGVVGTYPKPMLWVGFNGEELDVIPSKKQAPVNGDIALDVTYEDIVFIKPNELATWAKKPEVEQPKVLAVDFGIRFPESKDPLQLTVYRPIADDVPMQKFIEAGNHLCKLPSVPWKTVVFDNLSDLSDVCLMHIAAFQSGAMADARQWASMVGNKTIQVVNAFHLIPANTVFLMHSQIEKNELTGQVLEVARIYSGVRDVFGKLFSAFLYATKQPGTGKPVVWTTDQGFVRGIGVRWPAGLPAVCGPDYKSIYGRELA